MASADRRELNKEKKMKITNHKTQSLFASFLVGVTLAVALGLMVALSTSAFAMGGGGGVGESDPAPKIIKVDDSVAKPKDEAAEAGKPAVVELNTKRPEDKIETKPGERTIEFPKPQAVAATVGFAASIPETVAEGGLLELQIRISEPLSQDVALNVIAGGTAKQGTDYVISPATVKIPASTTSASLTLKATEDEDKTNETITLKLVGVPVLPDGVSFGKRTHTVAIIDNDVADDKTASKPGGGTVDDTESAIIEFVSPSSPLRKGGEHSKIEISISRPVPAGFEVTVREDISLKKVDEDTYLVTFNHTIVPGHQILPGGVAIGPRNTHAATFEVSGNLAEDIKTWRLRTYTLKPNQTFLSWSTTSNYNDSYVPHIGTHAGDETDTDTGDKTVNKPDGGTVDDTEGAVIEFVSPSSPLRKEGEYSKIEISISKPVPVEFGVTVREDISLKRVDGNTYSVTFNHTIVPGDQILPGGAAIGPRNTHVATFEVSGNLAENVETWRRTTYTLKPNQTILSWNTTSNYNDSYVPYTETRAGDETGGIEVRRGGDISIVNEERVGYISAIQKRPAETNDTSIENLATVDKDIYAKHRVKINGDILIKNRGTVGDDIEAWHRGNGSISIENYGTVGNEIYAMHEGDGDILISNQGNSNGMIIEHRGDSGIIHFQGNVGKDSSDDGVHDYRYELDGRTTLLGEVNFATEGYLDIYGDYEGTNDTQLNFQVVKEIRQEYEEPEEEHWNEGLLQINGDVTGQSRVSLVVDDPSLVTEKSHFNDLVWVVGDAEAGSFVGEQIVGPFKYVLEHSPQQNSGINHAWDFNNKGLSDTAVKTSQIADEVSDSIETPPTNNPDKQTKLGLWGEQNGSYTTMGLNALAVRLKGGDMVVGTSMSRNSSTSNNVNVESRITALTANWERKGFYAGGQTRYARFTSDVSTDRLSVVRNNEGTGLNASIDLGYRFALPFGGVDFEVAPQMQLVWSRVNFDDFVGPHGELVSLEDGDLVTGHLSLSWDGGWQGAAGFGRVYGRMNLRGAVDGKTSVNISGISIASERKGLSADGKLGLSYEWDEGYTAYGEVLAVRRNDANEVRANLGVRIDF